MSDTNASLIESHGFVWGRSPLDFEGLWSHARQTSFTAFGGYMRQSCEDVYLSKHFVAGRGSLMSRYNLYFIRQHSFHKIESGSQTKRAKNKKETKNKDDATRAGGRQKMDQKKQYAICKYHYLLVTTISFQE